MGSDLVVQDHVPAIVEEPASLAATARSPQEAIAFAVECADRLKAVLDQQALTERIAGNEHVKAEGWTLLAAMTGHTPRIAWTRKVDPSIGDGWEACAELIDGFGRVVTSAEAMALREEGAEREDGKSGARWAKAGEYAIRSMAQTRATSRAIRLKLGYIVSLAGYSATAAEEMPAGEPRGRKGGRGTPQGGGAGAPSTPPPISIEEFRTNFLVEAGVPSGNERSILHVKRVLGILGHRSWGELAKASSQRRGEALRAVRAQFAKLATQKVPVPSSQPGHPDYEVTLRRAGVEVQADCTCEGWAARHICRHQDYAWMSLELAVDIGEDQALKAAWGDLDLAAVTAEFRQRWEEAFPEAARKRTADEQRRPPAADPRDEEDDDDGGGEPVGEPAPGERDPNGPGGLAAAVAPDEAEAGGG